jgi:hypothetical protein
MASPRCSSIPEWSDVRLRALARAAEDKLRASKGVEGFTRRFHRPFHRFFARTWTGTAKRRTDRAWTAFAQREGEREKEAHTHAHAHVRGKTRRFPQIAALPRHRSSFFRGRAKARPGRDVPSSGIRKLVSLGGPVVTLGSGGGHGPKDAAGGDGNSRRVKARETRYPPADGR